VFVIALSVYNSRKIGDKRIYLIILSSYISIILTTSVLWIIMPLYLNIFLTSLAYLSLWIPTILATMILTLTLVEYGRLLERKGFDIDFVSRYHFKVSLELTILLTLLLLATTVAVNGGLLVTVLLTLTISILSNFFNHIFVRKVLNDRK